MFVFENEGQDCMAGFGIHVCTRIVHDAEKIADSSLSRCGLSSIRPCEGESDRPLPALG